MDFLILCHIFVFSFPRNIYDAARCFYFRFSFLGLVVVVVVIVQWLYTRYSLSLLWIFVIHLAPYKLTKWQRECVCVHGCFLSFFSSLIFYSFTYFYYYVTSTFGVCFLFVQCKCDITKKCTCAFLFAFKRTDLVFKNGG